ncbi:MAG: hypothetical protein ACYDAP_00235 [Thermoplasmataceae archaeon]
MNSTEINLLRELIDAVVGVNETLVKINENLSFMSREAKENKLLEDEWNKGGQ